MPKLKPCPFCGGEVEERGGSCNYGKHTITLDIKCGECGTIFKFKSNWKFNPIPEALEAWNRRASKDGGAGQRQHLRAHFEAEDIEKATRAHARLRAW